MRRRGWLALIGFLLVAAVAGSVAWHLYGRESGPGRLTVWSALRLCPSQGTAHIGTVTVDGYVTNVSVLEVPGALVGLFPTRAAAETASRARYGVYPPSRKAVWLRGGTLQRAGRTLQGIAMVSATGSLDCLFQLPGMGDASGTFSWLTIQEERGKEQ